MADEMTREEERWQSLGQSAQVEAGRLTPTVPMAATHATTASRRSYYDTRWLLVNRALAIIDHLTRGRAGIIQRLTTYLIIGGTAATINLIILALFFHFHSAGILWYWLVANAVAYEVAIMANFLPNDYFTFRHLAGHERSWLVRCVRFHITSLSGVLVTVVISAFFFHVLGFSPLAAQAIALIIATAYNFTVHHLFTYAHK